ncbi:MAG: hypoxanthine phosphoribosyltransferase [Lachnospiraceae bacterium]|jgi:hypoxanthine phosphoribosyltransferase|nr:hypoxanthine phosphoribosyltransferase [Lachnospiraceae bacterium]
MNVAAHQILISEAEVNRRIREIAEQINSDYADKSIHLVCVLKGSVMFMCELAKRLTIPVTFDFMSVTSYGSGSSSSGVVRIVHDLTEPIEGKDVIIIEDIIDSGTTMNYLLTFFHERHPASLKLCTLLDKPSRREVEIPMDYVGFQIPDEFIVGYGLDYDQKYRNLPYIGTIKVD